MVFHSQVFIVFIDFHIVFPTFPWFSPLRDLANLGHLQDAQKMRRGSISREEFLQCVDAGLEADQGQQRVWAPRMPMERDVKKPKLFEVLGNLLKNWEKIHENLSISKNRIRIYRGDVARSCYTLW